MLTGNKFYKLNQTAEIVKITTDDIPEGQYNKYCLNYADGKLIGDIVLRSSPDEVPCHSLLNGQLVYEYLCKDFYSLCVTNKSKASSDNRYEFFGKTLQDYEKFLTENIWQQTS